MTVSVRLPQPYFAFLLITPKSKKLNYTHQMTSNEKICPDVTFIDRSEEYCLTTG
jgi:hypothetical protein